MIDIIKQRLEEHIKVRDTLIQQFNDLEKHQQETIQHMSDIKEQILLRVGGIEEAEALLKLTPAVTIDPLCDDCHGCDDCEPELVIKSPDDQ